MNHKESQRTLVVGECQKKTKNNKRIFKLKIMKLELKHLASYLPYGLNIKDVKHGSVFEALHFITTPHQDFSLFKGNLDQLINDKYLKPILFPLSSLTKEITVNGETFVPIDFINKNIRKVVDIYLVVGKINIDIETDNYSQIINLIDGYEIMQKLIEWKFDVFRLIELGLAEPVTEDFNPYK